MKYQIDTIPVWEALEFGGNCMLCTLQAKTEADEVERTLGASVMEPDVRVKTNDIGICTKHQQMMFENGNRLGHALLMDTHAEKVLEKLEKLKLQTSRSRDVNKLQLSEKLHELSKRCVVCETIDEHMKRYFYTIVYLWKNDTKFQTHFQQSHGICLPHAAALIEVAAKQLNKQQAKAFSELCLQLVIDHLHVDESDLKWFTQKFDYKNQDKPWGNSKNAIERTVNRLRGYCLGSIPYDKPKK